MFNQQNITVDLQDRHITASNLLNVHGASIIPNGITLYRKTAVRIDGKLIKL